MLAAHLRALDRRRGRYHERRNYVKCFERGSMGRCSEVDARARMRVHFLQCRKCVRLPVRRSTFARPPGPGLGSYQGGNCFVAGLVSLHRPGGANSRVIGGLVSARASTVLASAVLADVARSATALSLTFSVSTKASTCPVDSGLGIC